MVLPDLQPNMNPGTVQPATTSKPPQMTDPRHQKFATPLPRSQSFPSQAPSLATPTRNQLTPADYHGIPIHLADDLKGDVVMANKRGLSAQTTSQLFPEHTVKMHIALGDDMNALKTRYPDASSLKGKRAAIIGPLPRVHVSGGKTYIPLPQKMGRYMGRSMAGSGQLNFPMLDDKIVPLLTPGPRNSSMDENMVGENIDVSDFSGWTAPIIIMTGIIGALFVAKSN